jgi:hypothetical protein
MKSGSNLNLSYYKVILVFIIDGMYNQYLLKMKRNSKIIPIERGPGVMLLDQIDKRGVST